jgi:CheY-like chemotaxis protein
MDGPELVDRIRTASPGLPVLYVSGYMKNAVPEQRFSEPSAGFLQKPFSARALCAELRRLARTATTI